ncbi:hypothetical protein FRC12_008670 [Ceratobasidium sp. 428]|nr:hypothetical protein FRC12_008670 [Ceratobasidium sp. 428]
MARHALTPATLELFVNGIWNFAYSSDGEHVAFIFDKSIGDSDEDSDEELEGELDEELDEEFEGECDGDLAVAIWNLRTGRCVASFGNNQSPFTSVAFSHDDLYVILGCDDGTVCIWDTQTCQMVGDPLRSCHSTDMIQSVACSPDGDRIVAGSSDNHVYIWSRGTGQIIATLPGHTEAVHTVAYSPDGACILSSSFDRTIRIWSGYSSQTLGQGLDCHIGELDSVAFSPNGAHVASGSKGVCIWNARTGELIRKLLGGHIDPITSVRYSPSGLHLVSGSHDQTVCIWDLLDGQLVTQLDDSYGSIAWVSYSPDGAQVLACSDSPGILYIWDSSVAEANTQTSSDDPPKTENALHTDIDNTPTSLDVADRVERVDETNAPRTVDMSSEGHYEEVSALTFSPDGAFIVSGSHDRTLRIWDVRTGKMVGQPLEGHTKPISSVSFSPNGTHVVSGSYDATMRIWDVNTCTALGLLLTGHTDGIRSVSYSPDGAHIASGSSDKTIRIWDAYTGKMVGSTLTGHTDGVIRVSYSPDGAFLASGSSDKTIRIWNAQTGRTVGDPLKGHESSVWSIAFSPDGLYIVACSYDSVHVWDTYSGSMIGQLLKPGRDQLCSVSFPSAGANFSFRYLNQAIHISHIQTFQDLTLPFRLDYGIDSWMNCVTFSPDGMQVASGYFGGTIRVSSIHIRQILDAEMKSHGDQPYAFKLCTCNICESHSDCGIWELDEDGWVVTGNSQRLIWVPFDLRMSLRLPHNTALMSRYSTLQLDFSNVKIGTSWSECYTPRA